jgi:hypothetical protein
VLKNPLYNHVRIAEMEFTYHYEVQPSLGGHRGRWKDNIKMNLKKCGVRIWTGFSSVLGSCEHT